MTFLDRLLTDAVTPELHGDWYDAVDARNLPGCVQQPRVPFAIAGGGRRAIALAALRQHMGDARRSRPGARS